MTSLTKDVILVEPLNVKKYIEDFWNYGPDYANNNNAVKYHETTVEEGIPE